MEDAYIKIAIAILVRARKDCKKGGKNALDIAAFTESKFFTVICDGLSLNSEATAREILGNGRYARSTR